MRAGISLPEHFSETINISRDRGWDSKKTLKNILYGSYFHLMKNLIHRLRILKEFSCLPDRYAFLADILNTFTRNTYLLIKPTELSQLIRCLPIGFT